jgi:hypothetical protein
MMKYLTRVVVGLALGAIVGLVAPSFVHEFIHEFIHPSHAALNQGGNNSDLGPVLSLNGLTTSQYSSDEQNYSAHALKCSVNITSITGTLTVTIYGKDGASGSYYSMLASPALNSTGLTVLTIGPGLTAASNSVDNDYLPPLWRVGAVAGGSGTVTGTIGCAEIE